MGLTKHFISVFCVAAAVILGGADCHGSEGLSTMPGTLPGVAFDIGVDMSGGPSRRLIPPSDPEFVVTGFRRWGSSGWQILPPEIVLGDSMELGVEVHNASPVSGNANLYVSVDIAPISDQPLTLTVTGSAQVNIPPYGSYVVGLNPAWTPGAVSNYRLNGVVTESGWVIGSPGMSVAVVQQTSACAVPAIDLPE
jgi:hypothetical protein